MKDKWYHITTISLTNQLPMCCWYNTSIKANQLDHMHAYRICSSIYKTKAQTQKHKTYRPSKRSSLQRKTNSYISTTTQHITNYILHDVHIHLLHIFIGLVSHALSFHCFRSYSLCPCYISTGRHRNTVVLW